MALPENVNVTISEDPNNSNRRFATNRLDEFKGEAETEYWVSTRHGMGGFSDWEKTSPENHEDAFTALGWVDEAKDAEETVENEEENKVVDPNNVDTANLSEEDRQALLAKTEEDLRASNLLGEGQHIEGTTDENGNPNPVSAQGEFVNSEGQSTSDPAVVAAANNATLDEENKEAQKIGEAQEAEAADEDNGDTLDVVEDEDDTDEDEDVVEEDADLDDEKEEATTSPTTITQNDRGHSAVDSTDVAPAKAPIKPTPRPNNSHKNKHKR